MSDEDGGAQRLRVDEIPEAISVHGLDGRYVWASPGFLDLFGIRPEWLIGRDAYELFHPDDVRDIQVSHETITSLPTTYTVQYRLRQGDGKYRWVESVSRVVENRRIIVSATRTIDRRRSALDALEAERLIAGRLRDLGRMQDGFLTAISHRTRHPLTVASGIGQVLTHRWRELDPGRVDQMLARMTSSHDKLVRLLDDVTQAEQLARRSQELHSRFVDVVRVAEEQVKACMDPAAPITIDVADGRLVFADPKLFAIVLRVLLANASEHTPVGTPVWVRCEQTAEGTVLVIDDAGDGVPKPRRLAIFEAFARGDFDDPDPGLGLGLHTVAEIAAAHRGRAWVEEREGGGASFRVLFPAASATTGSLTADLTDRTSQGRVILVVDDDPSVLALLRLALQSDEYRIVTVTDGAGALVVANQLLPDAIILDVMLPGIDGREVARRLRATPATSHIPIVICSALVGREDRDEAKRVGADAFIAKPFDVDELTRVLANAVLATEHAASSAAPETR